MNSNDRLTAYIATLIALCVISLLLGIEGFSVYETYVKITHTPECIEIVYGE